MQCCPYSIGLPSPVTSTTECCFYFGSISLFLLELFLHWSPMAYWAPRTWGVHLSVSYFFAFSYCSRGSQGKNIEVGCHSPLQWTIFCQNSPPWPVHFGWPYKAWFIASLSYTNPFARQGCDSWRGQIPVQNLKTKVLSESYNHTFLKYLLKRYLYFLGLQNHCRWWLQPWN